jgi:type II secretory ATPase GspE/PulE/Tfp pilus assembly ATPase PilB-like protein
VADAYLVTCWNCLGDFDALAAVWCSDDPKNPTKLCPFCLHCFCEASSEYKRQFWRSAPAQLVDELQTLSRSQDRLGDILIRMKKITTPQLLEALVEQRDTGRKFGEVLLARGFLTRSDLDSALKTQGVTRLNDTRAGDAETAYWQGSPDAVLDYLLALGARKGASDLTIEPQVEQVSIRYRIDEIGRAHV